MVIFSMATNNLLEVFFMKKLFKISITGGLTFLIALLFLMIQLPKTTVYAAVISKIAVTFDEPKAGDSATAVPKLKYDGDLKPII